MASTPKKISGWRRLAELGAFIAGATLVMFALSAIALVLYTRGIDPPANVELLIVDGTALAIAQGDNVLEIPPVWTFNEGDSLTVYNQDSVVHSIGEASFPTGETSLIAMDAGSGGEFLTTLHPNGVVKVSIEPSGFAFSTIAFTTLVFGFSVGIILYIGVSIARVMGHNEDDDWVDAPDAVDAETPAGPDTA